MKYICTSLDPLIPYGYNTTEGLHWTDVDNDSIPDAVESMLSNSSHFMDFYNFTHDPNNSAMGLWNNYAWSIAYYFSLKLHKNWDDVYSNLESNPVYWIKHYNSAEVSNASWADNATKYLRSQYNPFVVENMPPVILKFSVEFHYYGITAEFDVHALVCDAGAIKRVKIIDSDFGQSAEWNVNKKMAEINHTFWASPWGANLGANITVKAWDMRENRIEINKTILGPVGKTIEELWSLLPGWLRHGLQRLAREVVMGANLIWRWIVNMIKSTLEFVLSPIINMYNEWGAKVKSALEYFKQVWGLNKSKDFKEIFTMLDKEDKLSKEKQLALTMLLTAIFSGAFVGVIYALAIAMETVEYTLLIFMNILPGIGQVTTLISNIVIGELIQSVFEMTFYVVSGVTLGEAVFNLLYLLLPSDSVFWSTTVGAIIAGIGAIIIQYVISKTPLSNLFSLHRNGDLKDLAGFILAVVGGLICLAAGNTLLGSGLALFFSIFGLALAIPKPYSMVELIDKPIGFLDELIDSIIVGISLLSLISNLGE